MIGFSQAGLPGNADFNPGTGPATQQRTNPNVIAAEAGLANPGQTVMGGLAGTTGGHPITYWVAIFGVIVAIKFLAEKGETDEEFKNVRVGFYNIIVITLSSILGLIFLKWVFGLYKVPGLSALILAA